MRSQITLTLTLVASLVSVPALAGTSPVAKLPQPDMRMAGTTPATLPPAPRLLPQARQVNNPTGTVPNSQKWNSPPALPQAGQVRDCGSKHPKNC